MSETNRERSEQVALLYIVTSELQHHILIVTNELQHHTLVVTSEPAAPFH